MRTLLVSLTVACALGATARAGVVGTTLESPALEDFAQTKAKSFDDLAGRTVLLEFFAYW